VTTLRHRIIHQLNDKPLPAGQLAAGLEVDEMSVRRELRRMNEALIVRPTNRGWQLRTTYRTARLAHPARSLL
jgi:predicted ArsR family transcriptional regulator